LKVKASTSPLLPTTTTAAMGRRGGNKSTLRATDNNNAGDICPLLDAPSNPSATFEAAMS